MAQKDFKQIFELLMDPGDSNGPRTHFLFVRGMNFSSNAAFFITFALTVDPAIASDVHGDATAALTSELSS